MNTNLKRIDFAIDDVVDMVRDSLRKFSHRCDGEQYESWNDNDVTARVMFAIQDLPISSELAFDEIKIMQWYAKHWLIFAFGPHYSNLKPVQKEIVQAVVGQAYWFYRLVGKSI